MSGLFSRLGCLHTNLKVVGSSSVMGKNFHFIFFFRFPRAPYMSTGPIQMKSSMKFMRGNRCIGRMTTGKKTCGSTSS